MACCTVKSKEELLNGPKGQPMPMLESPPWWPPAPDLRYDEIKISVRGKEYIGYLVAPPAKAGKRPMILVIHNFQGLKFTDVHQAEYFARVGYVGLAVDLYDREVLPPAARLCPEKKEEIMPWAKACFEQMVDVDHDFPKVRELMQAWLDEGLKHESVDARVPPAAIGYCFGGSIVLDCVRGGLNFGGVVSLHGLLQPGMDPNPLKMCQVQRPPMITCENKYNVNTVIMIENGVRDERVQPENIKLFMEEFEPTGCDWQFHNHGQGCGHGFALPKSLGIPGQLHEKGDRRATLNMLNLFKQIFPDVPQAPVAKNAAGTDIPHLPQVSDSTSGNLSPKRRSISSQAAIIAAVFTVFVVMHMGRSLK